MTVLDFERLERIAAARHDEFSAGSPFPHVVMDDFLPRATAESVLAEFPPIDVGWNHYHHYNEKKLALKDLSKLGPVTQAVFEQLQSDHFVRIMETLTGISGLVSDPDLDGAGAHMIMPGGFLNVHTDFLAHTTRRTWSRQLNLLLYFNKDWRPEYNGDLELWDGDMSRCVRAISPEFNRCVIFRTMDPSFHGHPRKLACPQTMSRKSIALYYFREENAVKRLRPTNYRHVPSDPLYKRVLIAADRALLRGYSVLKRKGWLTDGIAGKILKRF